MRCLECGSEAVTERPERTAQGYRRFRCRTCGKQFNERSDTLLNRAQYPSDVIALVVLWRLRYKLSLRDLPEMFALRGIVFSYEAVRAWEAKLTPALAEDLRRRRRGKVGRSWYVDEIYDTVGELVRTRAHLRFAPSSGSAESRPTLRVESTDHPPPPSQRNSPTVSMSHRRTCCGPPCRVGAGAGSRPGRG